MLVSGKWSENWHPYQGEKTTGEFIRQQVGFTHKIADNNSAQFQLQSGRYRIYAGLICPWACRVLMARAVLGLEEAIDVKLVQPQLTDEGWRVAQNDETLAVNQPLHKLYTLSDASYTGRSTVPVLWDKQTEKIVNTESFEILEMLNGVFSPLAKTPIELYPQHLRQKIDHFCDDMYIRFNNGVYRAGFAKTQVAFDTAEQDVISFLFELETILANDKKFLFGQSLTFADIKLFVTLVRFDCGYHGLFKLNRYALSDFTNVSRYMQKLLRNDKIASTVNFKHIIAGYYSIKALNPTGIIPPGPAGLVSQ